MIRRTVVSAILVASAMPAMAHPGTHSDVPAGDLARHIASSPFHILGIAFVLAGAVAIVVRLRKSVLVRSQTD